MANDSTILQLKNQLDTLRQLGNVTQASSDCSDLQIEQVKIEPVTAGGWLFTEATDLDRSKSYKREE